MAGALDASIDPVDITFASASATGARTEEDEAKGLATDKCVIN